MSKAIAMHIELMQESGERIPKPRKKMQFEINDSAEEELCTWVKSRNRYPDLSRSIFLRSPNYAH